MRVLILFWGCRIRICNKILVSRAKNFKADNNKLDKQMGEIQFLRAGSLCSLIYAEIFT